MLKLSRKKIWKEIGETPLEALERFRATRPELKDEPMTYAGRLDPMAEGELLILIGDECKNREKYLVLDKEYEVGIVFGVSTDTHDALGIASMVDLRSADSKLYDLSRYIGTFSQGYPAFSSRTVNGIPLHVLARSGDLPEEMPIKEVEIYSIELLEISKISAFELKAQIFNTIDKVKGDFRQEEIKARWSEVLTDPNAAFETIRIHVNCSSGTYMRSLAHRIGKNARCGAFAVSIKRTKVRGV
jgi:tRNA pseudouridine55 synthase